MQKARDAFLIFKEGYMIINHNISAMYASRQMGVTGRSIDRNIEGLASGMRINRAGDDASGLAVSEKLRAQIRGLNQAGRNIQGGISFIQTTEGYLDETEAVLHRIRELSVQSANGIYSDEDRMMIQVEVSQLVDEVDRIASHAQFNGTNMLQGRFSRTSASILQFHLGANADQNERVYIGSMTASALALKTGTGQGGIITIENVTDANNTINTIDAALRTVNKQRADLGAYQNRLSMAYNGVAIAAENMQAAESIIRDTDMAATMVNYVKDQILAQANAAMLAQANTKTQAVIQLLG